jgi:hypothetical protein
MVDDYPNLDAYEELPELDLSPAEAATSLAMFFSQPQVVGHFSEIEKIYHRSDDLTQEEEQSMVHLNLAMSFYTSKEKTSKVAQRFRVRSSNITLRVQDGLDLALSILSAANPNILSNAETRILPEILDSKDQKAYTALLASLSNQITAVGFDAKELMSILLICQSKIKRPSVKARR